MLANVWPVICGYVECWLTCYLLFVVMFVQLIVTVYYTIGVTISRGCSNNLIRKIKNKSLKTECVHKPYFGYCDCMIL